MIHFIYLFAYIDTIPCSSDKLTLDLDDVTSKLDSDDSTSDHSTHFNLNYLFSNNTEQGSNSINDYDTSLKYISNFNSSSNCELDVSSNQCLNHRNCSDLRSETCNLQCKNLSNNPCLETSANQNLNLCQGYNSSIGLCHDQSETDHRYMKIYLELMLFTKKDAFLLESAEYIETAIKFFLDDLEKFPFKDYIINRELKYSEYVKPNGSNTIDIKNLDFDTFIVFHIKDWLVRGIEFENFSIATNLDKKDGINDRFIVENEKIGMNNIGNNHLIIQTTALQYDVNNILKKHIIRRNYLFEGKRLFLENKEHNTFIIKPENYFHQNQAYIISEIFENEYKKIENINNRPKFCPKKSKKYCFSIEELCDCARRDLFEYFITNDEEDFSDTEFNSSSHEADHETIRSKSKHSINLTLLEKKHENLSNAIQNDDENEVSLQQHEENKKSNPCQDNANRSTSADETIISYKKNFNKQKYMREKNNKEHKKQKLMDKIPKKITKKFFLELCDEYENLYGNKLDENVLNSEKSNIKYNLNDKIFKDSKFKPAVETDQIISNNMATFTDKDKTAVSENDNWFDEIKSENEIYDSDITDQSINEFSKRKTKKPFKRRLVSIIRKKKNACYNKIQKLKNLKSQISFKKMKKYNNLIYESEESCENSNLNDTSYPFNTINYDDPSSELTNNLNESPVLENRVSTTGDILSNNDLDTTPIPNGCCCIH